MLKILQLSRSHTCVNMCYYDLLWLTEYWLLCWLFCVHDISASMKALSLAWRYATVSCHSWQPASVNRKSAFLTRSTSLYKSNEPRPNTTKFLSSEDLCAQNQLLTFLARKPGDTICSYFCRYSFTKNQLVQWKIGCPRWRRFISFTSWSLLNHDFKSVNPTHVETIQARQPICPGNEWPCHRDQCSRENLWPPVKATWPVQLNLPPFSDPINQW